MDGCYLRPKIYESARSPSQLDCVTRFKASQRNHPSIVLPTLLVNGAFSSTDSCKRQRILHTFTPRGNQRLNWPEHTCFWTVGGIWSTQIKPTQAQGEHANLPHSKALQPCCCEATIMKAYNGKKSNVPLTQLHIRKHLISYVINISNKWSIPVGSHISIYNKG